MCIPQLLGLRGNVVRYHKSCGRHNPKTCYVSHTGDHALRTVPQLLLSKSCGRNVPRKQQMLRLFCLMDGCFVFKQNMLMVLHCAVSNFSPKSCHANAPQGTTRSMTKQTLVLLATFGIYVWFL